jgi:O-antigen ligase
MTVVTSISSAWRLRNIASTLPALVFLVSAFLAGGYYESTYSLLAALVWLGLAATAALRGMPRPSAATVVLLALTGWTLLSALWGPAGPALRAAPLVALYAGVLWLAEHFEPTPMLKALLGAIAIVGIAALIGRATGLAPTGGGAHSQRLAWPVTYVNGLGLVAVSGVVLALGLRLPLRFRRTAVAICGTTAALTYSRSALLVGGAALLVLAGARGRIPRTAAIAGAIVLAVGAVALAKPVAARFAAPAPDERNARRLLDLSGHGRTELWRAAWHEGRNHPLAGGGAGSWPRAYIAETHSLAGPANAHSFYLETFAELGVVGLALVLGFVAIVLARGRAEPAALAVFAAFALHATADWDWQLPAATLPAIVCAGALARRAPRLRLPTLAAACALAIGLAAGLHGVGAALLEDGIHSEQRARAAARLLPYDARPYAGLASDRAHACRIDPGEPVLLRAVPPDGGCHQGR